MFSDNKFYVFPLGPHNICLDSVKDRVHVTNDVGRRIFELHLQGIPVADINATLVTEFNADGEEIALDVKAFIEALEANSQQKAGSEEVYERLTAFKPTRALELKESQRFYISNASFEVRSECEGLVQRLKEMFILDTSLSSNSASYVIDVYREGDLWPIVCGGRTFDTGSNLGDAAVKVLREINSIVTAKIPLLIFMHAACVANRGGGILFPALGGVGKSTLTAYLIANGWQYLNDDVVPLLEGTQQLLPVTVALSVKRGSWKLLEEFYPEMAELRIQGFREREFKYLAPKLDQVAVDPIACQAIVLPRYSPECSTPEIVHVSPGETFISIFEGGGVMQRPIRPYQLSELVKWLDRTPCYKLHYKNLQDAQKLLETLA